MLPYRDLELSTASPIDPEFAGLVPPTSAFSALRTADLAYQAHTNDHAIHGARLVVLVIGLALHIHHPTILLIPAATSVASISGTIATAYDLELGAATTVDPDAVCFNTVRPALYTLRVADLPGESDLAIGTDITVVAMHVIRLASNGFLSCPTTVLTITVLIAAPPWPFFFGTIIPTEYLELGAATAINPDAVSFNPKCLALYALGVADLAR